MDYFSLNYNAPKVSFKEAVIKGLAPDKGLYFPSEINPLPKSFFDTIESLDNTSIAFEVIKQFVGNNIPSVDLKALIKDTLSFNFPIVKIEGNIVALELYHGPTMAFKDVGARFMARCLGYFNKNKFSREKITVLVATSGDTGGAVASGFLDVEGVEVVILYPSGKVSDIQEKQLTTLGKNITALEVNGTFDDCQSMVKEAFLDVDYNGVKTLTSANSINVARWLPQMFYFFFAYKELKSLNKKLVFSVPSGNYGNICAGMMAQKLGLPIHHFVAGTNINNVVPSYLETGKYNPKSSIQTISNAMDVGAPSNFIRIKHLYQNNIKLLQEHLSGYSYTDDDTIEGIKYLFETNNYISDPHGTIGYLALRDYLKDKENIQGVFLETAHPIKFLDVMPAKIADSLPIPSQISEIMSRSKRSIQIKNYKDLKEYLLQ
ncbi:threonine synthase [Flavobacteriaceae bacterium AU392]|nr:threonine synthase [Flavobacteriaceae bacterium]RKM84100.1 threonine synthase [Flavobacteriaceae bacterium AU392]